MAHTLRHLFGLPRPACASSPSTVRGAGRTWPCSVHARHPRGPSRSRSSTRADDPRLHLRRRHRRGRRARSSTAAAPNPAGRRRARPATSSAPYRVYNIGNDKPVLLDDCIARARGCLGKRRRNGPAHAAGRRAGHLCGRGGPGSRRLATGRRLPLEVGVRPVRGLVPCRLRRRQPPWPPPTSRSPTWSPTHAAS